MPELTITLLTTSLLGLFFIWLCVRIIRLRVKHEALIGDVGNTELQFAIRVQGNFTEFVPIFLILLGLLEHAGANSVVLAVMAALFVTARVLHVFGMGETANLALRQAGIAGSFTAIAVGSLYGLLLALS